MGHSGDGAAEVHRRTALSIISIYLGERIQRCGGNRWTDLEIPVAAASEAEAATDEALAARDSEADEALALYVSTKGISISAPYPKQIPSATERSTYAASELALSTSLPTLSLALSAADEALAEAAAAASREVVETIVAVVVAAVAVAVEVGAGAETVSLISAAVEEEVTVSVSVAVAVVVGAALWLATTAAHFSSQGPSKQMVGHREPIDAALFE